MDRKHQPGKEEVRQWMRQRRERPGPLPSVEQVRRQLGWDRRAGEERPPTKSAA